MLYFLNLFRSVVFLTAGVIFLITREDTDDLVRERRALVIRPVVANLDTLLMQNGAMMIPFDQLNLFVNDADANIISSRITIAGQVRNNEGVTYPVVAAINAVGALVWANTLDQLPVGFASAVITDPKTSESYSCGFATTSDKQMTFFFYKFEATGALVVEQNRVWAADTPPGVYTMRRCYLAMDPQTSSVYVGYTWQPATGLGCWRLYRYVPGSTQLEKLNAPEVAASGQSYMHGLKFHPVKRSVYIISSEAIYEKQATVYVTRTFDINAKTFKTSPNQIAAETIQGKKTQRFLWNPFYQRFEFADYYLNSTTETWSTFQIKTEPTTDMFQEMDIEPYSGDRVYCGLMSASKERGGRDLILSRQDLNAPVELWSRDYDLNGSEDDCKAVKVLGGKVFAFATMRRPGDIPGLKPEHVMIVTGVTTGQGYGDIDPKSPRNSFLADVCARLKRENGGQSVCEGGSTSGGYNGIPTVSTLTKKTTTTTTTTTTTSTKYSTSSQAQPTGTQKQQSVNEGSNLVQSPWFILLSVFAPFFG